MGHASALFNMQRQISAAIGVAVVAGSIQLVAARHADPTPTAGDFRIPFLVAASLAATAALFALRIKDADAVATMRPKIRDTEARHAASPS
jgi:hypothetical protein